MKVLALDLGKITGWAEGDHTDRYPRSDRVLLRQHDEQPMLDDSFNLACYLRDRWRNAADRPDVVVYCAPLRAIPIDKKTGQPRGNPEAMIHQNQLTAIVHTMARLYGIRVASDYEISVSKHFVGRTKFPNGRDEKKAAFVRQCMLLGYLPRSASVAYHSDQADAIGLWDYWCSSRCKRVPAELQMFNGAAKR